MIYFAGIYIVISHSNIYTSNPLLSLSLSLYLLPNLFSYQFIMCAHVLMYVWQCMSYISTQTCTNDQKMYQNVSYISTQTNIQKNRSQKIKTEIKTQPVYKDAGRVKAKNQIKQTLHSPLLFVFQIHFKPNMMQV